MKIKMNTLVVCDYVMPRSAVGIVVGVPRRNKKFKVFIVWPRPAIVDLGKESLTPICDGQIDDIRKIAKLFGWKEPW